jgi:hypothetical protein
MEIQMRSIKLENTIGFIERHHAEFVAQVTADIGSTLKTALIEEATKEIDKICDQAVRALVIKVSSGMDVNVHQPVLAVSINNSAFKS